MYHRVLKGSTGRYTVSPTQLENDFTAFKEAGFTGVFMSEVIAWVDGRGTLPEKPIVITFDDGYYNNLHYAVPIAQKCGMKIMISPVTAFSQHSNDSGDHSNPNYSHLTWTQIRDAAATGLVEFGNHTHNMHKFKPRYGIAKLGAEDHNEYLNALRTDIEKSQTLIENCGAPRPQTFAYPFGKYSREGREILIDLGFRALLTCNERVSKISHSPECLYELGRFNREGDYSTETILKKISKV
jgi:peptidoglycan/xylan/chitin deacetylase (PgdA/CDA1 family)